MMIIAPNSRTATDITTFTLRRTDNLLVMRLNSRRMAKVLGLFHLGCKNTKFYRDMQEKWQKSIISGQKIHIRKNLLPAEKVILQFCRTFAPSF
jgi:hypothetical protein